MGEKALRFLLWVNDISFIIGEIITKSLLMGVPSGSVVKNLPLMQETQVQSLGREDPQRRAWKPTPVFLPRKSHGQRRLVGYGPWGCKESDMTEATEHGLTHY